MVFLLLSIVFFILVLFFFSNIPLYSGFDVKKKIILMVKNFFYIFLVIFLCVLSWFLVEIILLHFNKGFIFRTRILQLKTDFTPWLVFLISSLIISSLFVVLTRLRYIEISQNIGLISFINTLLITLYFGIALMINFFIDDNLTAAINYWILGLNFIYLLGNFLLINRSLSLSDFIFQTINLAALAFLLLGQFLNLHLLSVGKYFLQTTILILPFAFLLACFLFVNNFLHLGFKILLYFRASFFIIRKK